MEFQRIDITGCRLVGALSWLGHLGPKHHAIVIGRSEEDDRVYIAENCDTGYQLSTYDDFETRFARNGRIQIEANTGPYDDAEVAQRALDELSRGGAGRYNLATNNCESFSNRAMHDHSISSQVIHTLTATAMLIGGIWLIKKNKKR